MNRSRGTGLPTCRRVAGTGRAQSSSTGGSPFRMAARTITRPREFSTSIACPEGDPRGLALEAPEAQPHVGLLEVEVLRSFDLDLTTVEERPRDGALVEADLVVVPGGELYRAAVHLVPVPGLGNVWRREEDEVAVGPFGSHELDVVVAQQPGLAVAGHAFHQLVLEAEEDRMVYFFADAAEEADGRHVRRFDDRPRARHDQQMPPAHLVVLADNDVRRSVVSGLRPPPCQLALILEHVTHHVHLAGRVFGVGERPPGKDLLRSENGLVLHAAQDMPAQETEKARKRGPSPW